MTYTAAILRLSELLGSTYRRQHAQRSRTERDPAVARRAALLATLREIVPSRGNRPTWLMLEAVADAVADPSLTAAICDVKRATLIRHLDQMPEDLRWAIPKASNEELREVALAADALAVVEGDAKAREMIH